MINEFNRNNEYREELERERRKAEIITGIGEDLSGEDWQPAEGEKESAGHNSEEGYNDSTVCRDDSISAETNREEGTEADGFGEEDRSAKLQNRGAGERGTSKPVEEKTNYRPRKRGR